MWVIVCFTKPFRLRFQTTVGHKSQHFFYTSLTTFQIIYTNSMNAGKYSPHPEICRLESDTSGSGNRGTPSRSRLPKARPSRPGTTLMVARCVWRCSHYSTSPPGCGTHMHSAKRAYTEVLEVSGRSNSGEYEVQGNHRSNLNQWNKLPSFRSNFEGC